MPFVLEKTTRFAARNHCTQLSKNFVKSAPCPKRLHKAWRWLKWVKRPEIFQLSFRLFPLSKSSVDWHRKAQGQCFNASGVISTQVPSYAVKRFHVLAYCWRHSAGKDKKDSTKFPVALMPVLDILRHDMQKIPPRFAVWERREKIGIQIMQVYREKNGKAYPALSLSH